MADAADDEPDRLPLPAAEDDAGSLVDQIKDLAGDTRTAVEAEIAWQSARAGLVAGSASGIAVWGGIAVACAFIAVLALAFGAILALVPIVGAVVATLLVSGVLLLTASIAALIARSRVRRVKAAVFPAKPVLPA